MNESNAHMCLKINLSLTMSVSPPKKNNLKSITINVSIHLQPKGDINSNMLVTGMPIHRAPNVS